MSDPHRASRVETWRMRRTLENEPPPAWPEEIGVRSFRPEDAPAVHALLGHAYRGGGGTVVIVFP